MGGTDDANNIVALTVAEHAEAHRILYEQHGLLEDKLAWQGLLGLIGKEEIVHAIVSRPRSQETKEKMRASRTGKKHSPETIEKLRLAKLGRSNHPWKGKRLKEIMAPEKYSQILKNAVKGGQASGPTSFLGKHHTQETRQRISLAKSSKL
jgi:hypothetical protein